MRVGQNPAKAIDHVPQPARVTVAVVTYIPFLSGYYAESLQVLKVCLESIWDSTPEPYDLLVFDNASCSEVRDYLASAHNQKRIRYLILSEHNIGKGGAWNMIFQGAPGEIIAYSDSDVLFSPGWLEHTLELLETFPRVGMVSSRPLRTPEKYYTSTLGWARQDTEVILEQGRFQSWETFKEHNDSMGISPEQACQWYEESIDWRIRYHNLEAYIGAAHFQFVAYKQVLQSLTPLQMDRPMGQVRQLDQMLNDKGYLRLTTCQPFARHLGNRLPAQQAAAGDQHSNNLTHNASTHHLAPIFNQPLVKRSLLKLYHKIFQIYFDN
jgi:hypothetical protein